MEAVIIWVGVVLCFISFASLARNDWLRLTRPSRRVLARVTGHRPRWDEGSRNFAAIYTLETDAGPLEVTDVVYTSNRRPDVGTLRELTYPEGRPELARPPRRAMWVGVYVTLMFVMAMLLAKWLGWLD